MPAPDGPGTFTVTALDLATVQWKKPKLQFEFADGKKRATGKNGDVLHLSVHAAGSGSYGGASVLVLYAQSTAGKSETLWAVLVTR